MTSKAYHRYVKKKIILGVKRAENEGRISQSAAERRLSRWLTAQR